VHEKFKNIGFVNCFKDIFSYIRYIRFYYIKCFKCLSNSAIQLIQASRKESKTSFCSRRVHAFIIIIITYNIVYTKLFVMYTYIRDTVAPNDEGCCDAFEVRMHRRSIARRSLFHIAEWKVNEVTRVHVRIHGWHLPIHHGQQRCYRMGQRSKPELRWVRQELPDLQQDQRALRPMRLEKSY